MKSFSHSCFFAFLGQNQEVCFVFLSLEFAVFSLRGKTVKSVFFEFVRCFSSSFSRVTGQIFFQFVL